MSTSVFVCTTDSPGKRIRLARIAAGLRQADVAWMANVTQHAVSAAERGKYVPPAWMERILSVLGLEGEGV